MEEEEDEDGATTASLKHFQVTTSQPGGVTRRLQWDETGEESLHRPEWRECSGRSFHFLCFSATRPSWPGPGSSSVRGCPPTNKQIFPQYIMLLGAHCPVLHLELPGSSQERSSATKQMSTPQIYKTPPTDYTRSEMCHEQYCDLSTHGYQSDSFIIC